jgi:hypothetical protein
MHDVEKRLRLAAEPLQSAASAAAAAVDLMIKRLGLSQSQEDGGERTAAPPAGPGGRRTQPPPSTGDYPSRGHFKRELDELTTCRKEEDLTARQLRRIAELTELLDGDEAAMPWWHRAAQAGDDLAAATLAHLHI